MTITLTPANVHIAAYLIAALVGGVLHYLRVHWSKGEPWSTRLMLTDVLAAVFAGGCVGAMADATGHDRFAIPAAALAGYWACQTIRIYHDTIQVLADAAIAKRVGSTVSDVRAARTGEHPPQSTPQPPPVPPPGPANT